MSFIFVKITTNTIKRQTAEKASTFSMLYSNRLGEETKTKWYPHVNRTTVSDTFISLGRMLPPGPLWYELSIFLSYILNTKGIIVFFIFL